MPPACPRRHDHTTHTPLVHTRHTPLAPCAPCGHAACVPSATWPHDTLSARSTSPPLACECATGAFAIKPRLLKNRFSLGATHPALLVYRLAPSPCGMTAASHARLLGRGLPEPPPPLVAAWLALSPCGMLVYYSCWWVAAASRRAAIRGVACRPSRLRSVVGLAVLAPPPALRLRLRPRQGRRGQGTKVAGAPAPGFFIGWRGRCQWRAGGCPAVGGGLQPPPFASAPIVASAPAIFTARSRNV